MLRRTTLLIAAGAFVTLAFCSTGCGSKGGDGNPKVVNPDAQKFPVQTPPPIGGAPAQKGAPKVGVQ